MADQKISQLTLATTPLAGTETLPVVQSSTTKQVSVANLTAGRSVAMANATVSASTVVVAGATTGSAGTFNSGTGTVALTGANARGINILFNANRNVNTTLPYGGSYEVFGLLSVSNMGTGAGYTTYGLAGYAESDGSPIGVRADAKSTSASSPAYGLYVGSVTGATNNYGIYVADAAANNYLGGNLTFGTAAKGVNFTANTPAAGMTSQLLNWYEEGTFTATLSATTPPTTPPTSTAYYTRVGRLVTVMVTFANVNTTGASGDYFITGLPFTSANNGMINYGAASSYQFANETAVAAVTPNSSQIEIAPTYSATLNTTAAGTGKYLRATVSYLVS